MRNMLGKYRCAEDIDIKELNALVKQNPDCILLDVRSTQEYKEGHLNGATNIPLYELEKNCNLQTKDKTIIVYCQSGIRSKKAVRILRKKGYTNLYNLENGLDGV